MRDRCAALRYLALGYRPLLRTTRRVLLVEEADETDERTQRVQPRAPILVLVVSLMVARVVRWWAVGRRVRVHYTSMDIEAIVLWKVLLGISYK